MAWLELERTRMAVQSHGGNCPVTLHGLYVRIRPALGGE